MTKAKDITPPHLRCVPGTCPSVHDLGDGNLLIVGRMASKHELDKCEDAAIGYDEMAIVISREYLPPVKIVHKKPKPFDFSDASDG